MLKPSTLDSIAFFIPSCFLSTTKKVHLSKPSPQKKHMAEETRGFPGLVSIKGFSGRL